jgi:hypothetical protein
VAHNGRVRGIPALRFEVLGVLLQRQREIVNVNVVIKRVECRKSDWLTVKLLLLRIRGRSEYAPSYVSL